MRNDENEYAKLKLREMELRQQHMIEIMKSRGVDYDLELRLKIQREKRTEKYTEFRDSAKIVSSLDIGLVGDGICEKCHKRRLIIINTDNAKVCKKCGTELSDKWTGIIIYDRSKK